MDRILRVAAASLGISLVVLALKAGAYWLTDSVALYSDALETVINVVAAVGALMALWFSGQPADANHPYGHQKAEYLSAVVEGALVLVTALLIAHEAWLGWTHPHRPDAPLVGILLNLVAGVINLGWALVLIRVGRDAKSPALVAGGRHLMTDVWTTAAVLAGFAMVALTGWLRLDPLIAIVVAGNILWAGYRVLREGIGGLMDETVDPAAVEAVKAAIARNSQGAIEAHDVRTRTAGRVTFVEFHLVVPGRMAVEDAHVICDRIEQGIRDEASEAVINIHIEPEGKAKHQGAVAMMGAAPLV